jgi:hypothetical protein
MTRFGFAGFVLAGALFVAPAFAADGDHDGKKGHDRGDHRPDFAAMHAEMCKDRYAGAVARTAYLEAKLQLSPEQQSLFGAWKDAVLQSAQSRESACSSAQRPEGRPDAVARLTHEETRLQERVAALQAELPPLTVLYQSLNPEQRRAFDHMGGHHMHGHDGMRGHGMWMHGHSDGDGPKPDRDSDHDGV